MQDSFINSPLVYYIALTLIHFIWQGALIALVLKAALIFTPQQKSQLRYAYTSGAMILNFLAPVITFAVIYSPENITLPQQVSETLSATASLTQTLISNEWHANIVEFLPYLTVVWLFIIIILSLKFLVELYSVKQLPKTNTIKPEHDLYQRFHTLSAKIGLSKAPQLLLSLDTHVPMAIGWIKPVVLIPITMLTGLTPAQLDMLILHELAHIRRHDYLINFIQSIVEIILFYHPCVLWVSNQMRNEREYCSDDLAVAHSGNSIAYAHTLADTASLCNQHSHPSIPNMAMAASGGDLTLRVLRLVDEHHCSSTRQISKWFAALTVLSIILLVTSQHLISFLNTAPLTSINLVDSPIMNKAEIYPSTQHKAPLPRTNNVIRPSEQENGNSLIYQAKDIKTDKNEIRLGAKTNQNSVVNKPQSPQKRTSQPLSKMETQLSSDYSSIDKPLDKYSDNKSSSELSFERTDSRVELSPSYNPYSKQLLNLSAELSEIPQSPHINEIKALDIKLKDTTSPELNLNQEPVTPPTNNAELIYSVPPIYPDVAERKGIEIEVKVSFTIDKNGYVKDIVFPTMKHHRNFFKSSVRLAIKKWRFIPAQQNGQAVESKMSKIFSFTLEE